jgi:hypothetical protein
VAAQPAPASGPASVARAQAAVRGLHRFRLDEGMGDEPTPPPSSARPVRPVACPRP